MRAAFGTNMGLHRRHSSAAAAAAGTINIDDRDNRALNAVPAADNGAAADAERHAEDILKWRTEMDHPPVLPGFRGLWQSQGRVLMLFALSLAALVFYISSVSASK